MKNVKLISCGRVHRLYSGEGEPIDAFNAFALDLINPDDNYANNTILAYCSAAAKFTDYLIETGCLLGKTPPTLAALKKSITEYGTLLAYGQNCRDQRLNRIAISLNRIALKPSSLGIHMAAIKKFLSYCDEIAKESFVLSEYIDVEISKSTFLLANEDKRTRGFYEKSKMQEKSTLAGNLQSYAKYHKKRNQKRLIEDRPYDGKHFPPQYLIDLLEESANSRDKLLWALLAGGGLRQSEGLSITTTQICPINRSVKVSDPNGLRQLEANSTEKLPWKGRENASIYIYEPLKTHFFLAYEEYLKVRPSGGSNFVFKYINKQLYGQDMISGLSKNSSLNSSMNEAFRKAICRINDKYQKQVIDPTLSLHSLRHSYGYYLLNFHRVPGRAKPGLEIEEVQKLMGHSDIESTKKYAQQDRLLFEADLAAADQALTGSITAESFSQHMATILRIEADKIERR